MLFLIIYPIIFDSKIALLGDNANYFILAKGLASGEGYINYHMPQMEPANHFPPGYSFIMSLVMRLGFDTINSMKVLNGVFLLLIGIFSYLIANKITKNATLGFVLAILVLLNRHLLEYSTIIMSELCYTFFLLLTVYAFLKARDNEFSFKNPWFYILLIALVLSIYIRTQGIVLFGALLFYLIFQKKWSTTIITAVIVIGALAPWQIRTANLGGSSYMKQIMRVEPYNNESPKMEFGNWVDRIGVNFVRYVGKEIPSTFFTNMTVAYNDPATGKPQPSTILRYAIGTIIILLTLYGIWQIKYVRWFFLPLFGASFLIFMLWPEVWFGIRFYLPLFPITFLFTLVGFFELIKLLTKNKIQTDTNQFVLYSPLIFLFILIPTVKKLQEKAEGKHPKNWENFLVMSEWANEELPEDVIIASRKPALSYMMSNRFSVNFPYTADVKDFIAQIKEVGVTHIIVEQLGFNQTGKYLVPIVKNDPEKFKVIHALAAKPQKDKNGKQIPTTAAVWMIAFNDTLGYNGPIVDNKRNGEGTYTYSNGTVIKGTWVNDTLNGPGIMTVANNRKYVGEWKNGKKNGRFYIYSPEQTVETYWNQDTISPVGYFVDKNLNRIRQIKVN